MTPEASQSCFWKAVEARMRTRIPPRYSLAGCASANCVLPRHQRCCRGGNQPPASVAELDQLMAAGCSFSHPHLVGRGFAASGGAGPAQDPSRCCRHALRKIKDGTLCVAGTLSDAALKAFRSRMAAFRTALHGPYSPQVLLGTLVVFHVQCTQGRIFPMCCSHYVS